MRPVFLTLAALALTGLLGAAAVVFIGLYNVSARAGHWPGVSWVLHTTFENAVRLRAPPAEDVPDLSAPGLAELGAGHYASACAFCHGLPGEPQNATALSMMPVPPHVSRLRSRWKPEELHWIIYEGAKMTGMPHWPAQREDEVWAVVAYLESIPAGGYPVHAEAEAEDPSIAYCAGCHGLRGRAPNPFIPRLDIQTEEYLAKTLSAYRTGQRPSGVMQHAASQVSEPELARVTQYYSDLGPAVAPGLGEPTDPGMRDTGERLARRGTDDVPACTACHGPDAEKGNRLTPRLAGQHRPYLEAQLRLWRDGKRHGGERANLMTKAAQDLTDADISALAEWYAARHPALETP